MTDEPKRSRLLLLLAIPVGFAALICATFLLYKPDRPVAKIDPGSSSGPAFVVQIIRPRMGLPLGGILPPHLFGQDSRLVVDSSKSSAMIGSAGPERFQFSADDWELVLVVDAEGRVSSETQVVFEMVFEDEVRKVRGRPADPVIGTLSTDVLDSGELHGSFDIELERCEDASTGEDLGWPPDPLILHGSFDRLAPDGDRP